MKSIRRPLLILSLCTAGLAVACDPGPEATGEASAEVLELSVWPMPPPAGAADRLVTGELAWPVHEAAKPKPPKFKYRAATDTEAARWVQWVLALPWSNGPVNDPDGSSCAWGQGGPVWYLAGTAGGPVERECDIPKGKDLVFPLVNWWYIFFPMWYPNPEEPLEAAVLQYVEVLAGLGDNLCSLTLRVDGVDLLADVSDLTDLFIVTEEGFPIDVNEDNLLSSYGVTGGPGTAITSGGYVRVKALKPGDHVLELGGTFCEAGEAYFDTYAEYHLHVGD